MKTRIKVALAEDHLGVRQGYVKMLNEEEDIQVVFDSPDGKDLLEKIKSTRPEIVLLDVNMPIMDGRQTLSEIKRSYADIQVIMLTFHAEPGFVQAYLSEGASAFLNKGSGIEEIVQAIREVRKNGAYQSEYVQKLMERHNRFRNDERNKLIRAGLTNREIDVYNLLRAGKTRVEIEKELGICDRTVEGHRQNLTNKLKDNNCEDLINWSNNSAIWSKITKI